jgi:hypothetical protein
MDAKTGFCFGILSATNPISKLNEMQQKGTCDEPINSKSGPDSQGLYGHAVTVKFVNENGHNREIHGVANGRSRQLAKTLAHADAIRQLFPNGLREQGT